MDLEQPYLDGELTLFKLSVQVGVPPHQLSKLVNQYGMCNFFDFVNQYRVAALQEKIRQGQHEQQTLLALALDSGFNSKASFNRVFKKMTGMTPRQYVGQVS
jgi:AraC-like DNA-binding protein